MVPFDDTDRADPAPSETAAQAQERRRHPARELLLAALRMAYRRAHDLRAALGLVIIAAAALAAAGMWAFVAIAEEVREGDTQRFDEAALRYLDQYDDPLLEKAVLEVTALGNGSVVLVVAGIAGLFLWLTRHRYSATMLLVATSGGLLMNWALKLAFDRPRPQVVQWGTHVVSSSFPSGHATSAAVVYVSVAYLAARLQRRVWARWVTVLLALVVAVLIAFSRLMAGVHYPSDVIAGMATGLAWAAFCMVMLEAVERFIVHDRPQEMEHEAPSPEGEDEMARPAHDRRHAPRPPQAQAGARS